MVPPGIELYVEGVTSSGKTFALFATATRPARVIIVGDLPPLGEKASSSDFSEKRNPKKLKCRPKKGKQCPEEPPPGKSAGTTEKSASEGAEWVDTSDSSAGDKASARDAVAAKPTVEKTTADEFREKPAEKAPPKATESPEPSREVSAPKRPRTALEEELAVYGAEAPSGIAPVLDERTRTQVLAPVVLTAAQLKQLGVRFVHEALDLVPGVAVSRDVQGFYRVAVRGLRSAPEVLFLLDGQRLNHFYDGQALATLPVDNLERIEIFRGPATADVGPGNFLAVVNLVTQAEEGIRGSFTGGSFDAFDGHLVGGKKLGAVAIRGDADVVSQYGYRKAVTRDGLDPPTGTPRTHSTLDNRFLLNVGLLASLDTGGAGTFGLSGRLMLEQRSALVGLFDVVGNDSSLRWQSVAAALTWARPLGELGTVSARLFFDQQATNRLWQLTPDGHQVVASNPATAFADGLLEQVTVGARTFGLSGRSEWKLPANNQLALGLDVQLQSLSTYAYLANYVPETNENAGSLVRPAGLRYPTENGQGGRGPAADRFSFGLYSFDTWTPLDVLSIQAGLRLDFTQLPTATASGAWTGAALVPSFGPRLGLAVTPSHNLVFRGHYGRAWRAPTVQELAETIPDSTSNQGRAIGNPNLQGAYLDLVEGGAEYLQGVGDAKLRLKAGAFFERSSNAIALIDTTGNLVPYSNRPAGVQSWGIEGEARLEVTPRAVAWLNAAWQRAQDLGTPPSGRLLTDVPQVRFNGGVSLPLGPYLNIDLVLRYHSERRNNSRSVLEQIRRYTLPAYTTVAAQLRTEPLFEHLELVVLGQNVFTFDYSDDVPRPDRMPGGVPREGLLVFGTVRVSF
jgi:outer membrane receptor protein involved in Fe transport